MFRPNHFTQMCQNSAENGCSSCRITKEQEHLESLNILLGGCPLNLHYHVSLSFYISEICLCLILPGLFVKPECSSEFSKPSGTSFLACHCILGRFENMTDSVEVKKMSVDLRPSLSSLPSPMANGSTQHMTQTARQGSFQSCWAAGGWPPFSVWMFGSE